MRHNQTMHKLSQFLSMSLVVATTGCSLLSSSPKSQEEVGAVNVSVTLVAPWEEYVTALAPNFTLSASDAVNKVIPRAGIVEEKILDALGLSARVGFPQTSESTTKTINTKSTKADSEEAKESSSITEDKTEKKEAGKLPDAPSRTQGADKGVKDLPGVPADSGKGLRNDPMLEYTVATALYQEVQLLNRYVTDAALRHDMNAYIVRLQIGIVPFRRNLGYDIYTKIGFFPRTNKHQDKEAFVLPLLVTDNLEGTLASRTQDTIRQLSLAVSFMKAGVVGTVGADRVKEELDTELFTEVNSLFTLGRVTNNALGARFGAVRQGKNRYSIIPRTHNVTLVLMVPNKERGKFTDDEKIKEVRVVAKTSMRSTEDGAVLPQQGREDRKNHVGEIVKSFLTAKEKIDSVEAMQCTNGEPPPKTVPCTQALLQLVWANDFAAFEQVLIDAEWKADVGRYSRDLWMDIVESLDRSQFSGVRFELPNTSRPIELPIDQAVLLLDDAKSQMKATLTGGRGLVPTELRAVLHLELETGETVSLVGSIASDNGGGDLVLTFPSPAQWKLNELGLPKANLELERLSHDHWASSSGQKRQYKSVAYRNVNAPIKPGFAITKTVDVIRPDASHRGSVLLFVEFAKDFKKTPLAKQVELVVEGADLVQAQFTEKGKDEKKSLTRELGKVIVDGDGTLELQFQNLDKSKKVVVKSSAKEKDGKAVGGEHADVTFDVSEAAAK